MQRHFFLFSLLLAFQFAWITPALADLDVSCEPGLNLGTFPELLTHLAGLMAKTREGRATEIVRGYMPQLDAAHMAKLTETTKKFGMASNISGLTSKGDLLGIDLTVEGSYRNVIQGLIEVQQQFPNSLIWVREKLEAGTSNQTPETPSLEQLIGALAHRMSADHTVRASETVRGQIEGINASRLAAIKDVAKKFKMEIDLGGLNVVDGLIGMDIRVSGPIATVIQGLVELQAEFARPLEWLQLQSPIPPALASPVPQAEQQPAVDLDALVPTVLATTPVPSITPVPAVAPSTNSPAVKSNQGTTIKSSEQIISELAQSWYSEIRTGQFIIEASPIVMDALQAATNSRRKSFEVVEIKTMADVVTALQSDLWKEDTPYVIYVGNNPRYIVLDTEWRDLVLSDAGSLSTIVEGTQRPIVPGPSRIDRDPNVPIVQMAEWCALHKYTELIPPQAQALSMARPIGLITRYGKVAFVVVYGRYAADNDPAQVLERIEKVAKAPISPAMEGQLHSIKNGYWKRNFPMQDLTATGNQHGIELLADLSARQRIGTLLPRHQRQLADSQQDRLLLIPVADLKHSPRVNGVARARGRTKVQPQAAAPSGPVPSAAATAIAIAAAEPESTTPQLDGENAPFPGDRDTAEVFTGKLRFPGLKGQVLEAFVQRLVLELPWTVPDDNSKQSNIFKGLVSMPELRKIFFVTFNYSHTRDKEGIVDLLAISEATPKEQKAYFKKVAAHHELSGGTYEILDGSGIVIGGRIYHQVQIHGSIVAKLIMKHQLTKEEILDVFTQVKEAYARGDAYEAKVSIGARDFTVAFHVVSPTELRLKTMFDIEGL